MKTYDEAKLTLQKQAFSCGAVCELPINGKALTVDASGYAHLDGVKVQDMATEVYPFIQIDEEAIQKEMTRQ